MGSLKEEAKNYQPPKTLNIVDLDKVPIDLELKDGKGTDKEGEQFEYKYVEVDGKEYRVPGSVIGMLKQIIEKKPDTKVVSVIKQGTGLGTRYQVIPVE